MSPKPTAKMNPFEDRLRQEVRDPAHPERAEEDVDHPDAEGERDDRRQVLRRGRRDVDGGDRRGDCGDGCRGPGDDLTCRGEHGVEDRGTQDRVQPVLGWDADNRRVAQRLRDDQRPHGQAGKKVGRQPLPLVVRQPVEDRHDADERVRPPCRRRGVLAHSCPPHAVRDGPGSECRFGVATASSRTHMRKRPPRRCTRSWSFRIAVGSRPRSAAQQVRKVRQ